MRALWFALLPALAFADASVRLNDDLTHCTMEDGPHRRLWKDPRAERLRPKDMSLRDASGRWFLFANHWNAAGNSILIDTQAGTRATLAGLKDTQLVMDETGELHGLLALREVANGLRALELWTPAGKLVWRSAPQSLWGDSAATLVAGDLLIVGAFHRIATGSALIALDLATGKLRWQADVEQLQVSHSKYFNDVSLERRGSAIVMRGFEAAGCYRQTFDLQSGKRLSAQMPKLTW